jgi:HK97 family phage prohead protease
MGEIMIVRTKSGEMMTANGSALLELLGVKQESGGVQKVAGDVMLFAEGVITKDDQATEGVSANPDGFAWVLSTFDLDRFGERIDPAGWDFSQFLKNPVVEWAHNFLIPAIGKIEGLTVDESGLHGRVIFNGKEYDPFGWAVGQRVAAGVIRAGSVGFRVIEIEIPNKTDRKDGTSLIFRKQELVEFSICNVPANPHALVKTMRNESGTNAGLFWGGLINNE